MEKASNNKSKPHLVERTLPLFLLIIVSIIIVLQAQIMLGLQSETERASEAAGISSQDAALAVGQTVKPFAALDENCTRCHSERRFAGFHGKEDDVSAMISHMEMHSDVELSQTEVDRIHDSIVSLKCVKCHSEDRLQEMAGMSKEEQFQTIERMRGKPGANISATEVKAIERAIQNIQGF